MKRPEGSHPIYWRTFHENSPSDWQRQSISGLCSRTKGKLAIDLSDRFRQGAKRYLLTGSLNGDETAQYTLQENIPYVETYDTIMAVDGTVGKVFTGIEGVLGSTMMRFRPYDVNDSLFLFYLLQSLESFSSATAIVGAVPHLDKRLVSQLVLAIPEQQERVLIGHLLSSIDKAISSTKTEVSAAGKLKTAMMQQLFTKGIPGYHSHFSHSKWFTTPQSWKTKMLRDLADVKAGFTMGRDLSGLETIKIPYVTVVNVQEGFFDLDNISSVKIKISEMNTGTLKRNDVLVTEGGDRDKLGRGAIWSEEINPCAFQNHIFRVRFRSEEYRPKLFHYLIQSWQVKRYFYSHAKQTSNLCTINSRELKKLPINIPDPDEQEKMIEMLETVDAAIHSCKVRINALVILKRALLQTLLTGKVRIKPEGIK